MVGKPILIVDDEKNIRLTLLTTMEVEIRGDRVEAQKNCRAALSLDPSYGPAISNLERSTQGRWKRKGPIDLGGNIPEPDPRTPSSADSN